LKDNLINSINECGRFRKAGSLWGVKTMFLSVAVIRKQPKV
jgi:hypothetical protein